MKILIITQSGGNGLLQAANAIETRLKKEIPEAAVIQKRILEDLVGSFIGFFGTNLWNWGMKSGKANTLKIIGGLEFLADYLFHPFIYKKTLALLKKENIDRIIDVQPVGIAALAKAVSQYNKEKNKNIKIEKVISDLPTNDCGLHFSGIKKLSEKAKQHIEIHTIEPLLEEGQTLEEFWRKNCSISEDRVHYVPYYVREAFTHYTRKKREKKPFSLSLQLSFEEKNRLLAFNKNIFFQQLIDGIQLTLQPEDRLITILLGSQPSKKSTLAYCRKLISYFQKNPSSAKTYLFVYVQNYQTSLGKKIFTLEKNLPENLLLIPMPYQKESTIASLYFRSDITITRSAGQTVMELLSAGKGKIFLHTESKKNPSLSKMPKWEAGCAKYLQKRKKAVLVCPNTITKSLTALNS